MVEAADLVILTELLEVRSVRRAGGADLVVIEAAA